MKAQTAIPLDEQALQEIFALFSSPSDDERRAVYDPSNRHYFRTERLDEEYHLTQEKREFAIDAWRAVAYFLRRHGYAVSKDGTDYDLLASSQYSE